MAQALNITVDSVFDATLPVSLHSLGVVGAANRYVADTLTEAVAAQVASWADKAGTLNLVSAAPNQSPVVGSQLGFKYLSFDGVQHGLKASFANAAIKTVAMVVRVTTATGSSCNYMFGGGVNFNRDSGGAATMFFPGLTTNPRTNNGSMPVDKWHVVIYTVGTTAADTAIQLNGIESATKAAGTPAGVLYQYSIGREATSFGKFDLAEMIGFPGVLDAAQRLTVYNSLKNRYAALLAA
jgi:hypothetical protein